jgi:transposase InsO family protein
LPIEMEEVEALLKRIYYDPKRGLGSAEKLYREANAESGGLKISHATVKAWLEKQSVHQRFRHVKATYMPIVGKPGAVQADLTFHGWRKDLIPILTVIDLTSRYAWAVVLPNKEEPTVSKAFEKILESERGKKIKIIETDSGSEFITKRFAEMLADHKVELVLIQVGDKTSLGKIERFNRTL